MLYNGEKLRIPSTNEWPQNMGEMLHIPGNNNNENNNNNNNNKASTATSNSNSGTSTNNNMIHASAAAAPPPAARVMDKPAQDQQAALKCPRCDSSNTKFCYYNNYSLSQPRYFCKGCRRYWTKGGSLRNVPVGGGCRKNKRSSSSTSKRAQDQALTTRSNPSLPPFLPPPFSYDPNDFSLAFARLHAPPTPGQLGLDDHDSFLLGNPNPNLTHIPTTTPGFLDILRGGLLDTTTNTNAFHNLYYGFGGHGRMEEVEGGVPGEELVLPFDGGLSGSTTTTTASTPTASQRSCKAGKGEESKVFMGLQWQVGRDGNMAMDPGRERWNGVGSSWPGLINSSLM